MTIQTFVFQMTTLPPFTEKYLVYIFFKNVFVPIVQNLKSSFLDIEVFILRIMVRKNIKRCKIVTIVFIIFDTLFTNY